MTLDRLYTEVYRALNENLELIDIVGENGVYDYTPDESVAGPYVVIGDFDVRPGRLLNSKEKEVTFSIHVWSSNYGRFETMDIGNVVDDGIQAIWGNVFYFESFQIIHDVEQWVHGILTYKTYIEEE